MIRVQRRFFSLRHILVGVVVLLAVTATTSVRGDIMQIGNDTNALPGWHDVLHTNGVTPFPPLKYLNVDVQYAVYKPGDFDSSFPGGDPSSGTQYVYAYQLFNLGTSTDSGVSVFSVGVNPGACPIDNLSEIDNLLAPSTKVSSFYQVGTTSVNWSFDYADRVVKNSNSMLVLFTSPYGPAMKSSNLVGWSGATTAQNPYSLPSPVPEPGTLVILAIAGALIGLCRVVRQTKE